MSAPSPLQQVAQQVKTVVSHLMMNPDHKGPPAILVEGSCDRDLLSSYLPRSGSHVLKDAGNKKTALDAAEIASSKGIPVLAVVDADHEVVIGSPERAGFDVVTTDLRDLEAMMFMSPAGDRFITMHLHPDHVAAIEAVKGKSVKQIVVEELSFVGALRTVSQVQKRFLSFSKLRTDHYVDECTIELDRHSYFRDLLVVSDFKGSVPRLQEDVQKMIDEQPAEVLLPGHDLTYLLAKLCRGPLSVDPGSSKHTSRESVERTLRTAFAPEYFRETRMYASLASWARNFDLTLSA